MYTLRADILKVIKSNSVDNPGDSDFEKLTDLIMAVNSPRRVLQIQADGKMDIGAIVERNEELEETMAKAQIVNGEMREEINLLIEDRDELKRMNDSLIGHTNDGLIRLSVLAQDKTNLQATVKFLDSELVTLLDQRTEHIDELEGLRGDALTQGKALSDRIDELVTLLVDLGNMKMAGESVDSLKRESTWKTAQIREKDHLIKELKGNVRFLDDERDLLLKQRTSLQAKLKDMTTAKDSLAGQLSDARSELITTNGLMSIKDAGEMSSAKASELRNQASHHMRVASQMRTKLNKIEGILRNP